MASGGEGGQGKGGGRGGKRREGEIRSFVICSATASSVIGRSLGWALAGGREFSVDGVLTKMHFGYEAGRRDMWTCLQTSS